tara:strand:- start:442 stop:708 length:267 start_codon:yes stop_codon:yes gene_type:complete
MKTVTKIEYSNDTETKGQYTAYVTCANDEAMYSLTQFIESKTSIESLGCGGEEEGRIYETFSTTWAMNKKEFLQELRATIKEWKQLNK